MIPEARDKVVALERAALALPENHVEIPLTHYFAHKAYVRRMDVPAGTAIVGKIHKYKQVNVLLKGQMSVLTDKGVELFTAPHVFEAPAGSKRAMYAHEDSAWLVILGSEETDVDKLEEELVVNTFEEFDQFVLGENKCLSLV